MDEVLVIKTKRLLLRDLLEEDGQTLHQLRSNPIITQYIQYIKSETEAETYQWFRETMVHNARIPQLSYNLVIIRKVDH